MLASSSCEVLPLLTWYFTRKEQNKLESLKRKEYWKEHLERNERKEHETGKNYVMNFVVLFTKYYWVFVSNKNGCT